MPPPDYPGYVIPASTGYARTNQSWILGRVLRDFESWMDKGVEAQEEEYRKNLHKEEEEKEQKMAKQEGRAIRTIPKSDIRIALRLSIYDAVEKETAGKPSRDLMWWSGIIVILLQLGISILPCAIYNEWVTLAVTVAGTILALLSGALPQWAMEKWSCRRGSDKIISLTAGNGFKDAVVICGNGVGLDLEDLATARRVAKSLTRVALSLSAICWLILLIAVAGFSIHTWYIVSIGSIGMIHNVLIAGRPRTPQSFGIHIRYKGVILGRKAMDVLVEAERQYPRLGSSLVATYFPGRLRTREQQWWDYAERRAAAFEGQGSGPRLDISNFPLPKLRGDDEIPRYHLLQKT